MELFYIYLQPKTYTEITFPNPGPLLGQESMVRQVLGLRGEPPTMTPAAKWNTALNWLLLTYQCISHSSEKLQFAADGDQHRPTAGQGAENMRLWSAQA